MADLAFRQFVLKVHSLCNLACDHCYVYEAADQSWRAQPKSIELETVRWAARRMGEHAARHHLDRVGVVLHGGEPLLVGHDGLRRIVEELRRGLGGAAELDLVLQTNGVLLDERFARFLLEERIRVGISLDGGPAANDRHRRFAHGGGSYEQVAAAVQLMASEEFRPIFAGLLCTVDAANDPVQVFHDLAALKPPKIDFLLPHATWDTPPPAAQPGRTVYGDWLVKCFDAWYDAPPVIGVRLFQEAMHALLGGASLSEAVGLSSPESIVIETNGAFERTDALKIAYHGACSTGYNVFDHSLEDVLAHPAIIAAAQGIGGLAACCQACPIVSACGGGLFPHRYRATNGFDNPTVYCHDLARLINHISDRMAADLSTRADPAICTPDLAREAPLVMTLPDEPISAAHDEG
jgi:uncharacterized protein